MDALLQALSRWVDPQRVGAVRSSWSGRLAAALQVFLARRIIARGVAVWSRHAIERILREPAPVLMLLELGDSSVNVAVRPWVSTPDCWPVCSDLLQRVKHGLESSGLSIPFPQRDVHIVSQTAAGQ
jgi:small-conductance mechanosensitive channel